MCLHLLAKSAVPELSASGVRLPGSYAVLVRLQPRIYAAPVRLHLITERSVFLPSVVEYRGRRKVKVLSAENPK